MKISLNLPEWATENGQSIYIFAGGELVATKLAKIGKHRKIEYEKLKVKTIRCDRCGRCCLNTTVGHKYGRRPDGSCMRLKFDEGIGYTCKDMPLSCAIGKGEPQENCCIKFEEIK